MKKLSTPEKWMIALAVVLLVGVVVRWSFVRREAGDAFRQRLEYLKGPGD